jgi:hypothetical protein
VPTAVNRVNELIDNQSKVYNSLRIISERFSPPAFLDPTNDANAMFREELAWYVFEGTVPDASHP